MMNNKVISKKLVCLVIPSLGTGGMERVMSELANYFSKMPNVIVHLVLYGIDRKIFYPINNNIIIHTPPFKFDNRYRTLSSLRTMHFLRKKIIEINPTTILSFGEYWNSFVLMSLYRLKFPIYISDRCQPNKNLGRFQTKLRKWLYPFAKGIIAQTGKAQEIYKKEFPKSNIETIGNPIRKIETLAKSAKENIIISVGRLIKTKNHDKLIEIFARINEPNWKLVIVGDDAQKQNNMTKLQELIQSLKLEKQVILAGNIANVEDYYLTSKIFAFTSSSEGFPNVIGEAQSAGLPVIAFDCIAGPSDMVIDGKNGYLVPLFDYAGFEKKLRDLMQNEHLRVSFGEYAKKSIQNFSIDSIGQKFYDFILKNEGTSN